jgi:hypothetical protein
MNNYCNIIEAISDSQVRGFTFDFSLIGKRLLCAQEQRYMEIEELEVREIYRFSTKRAPDDATIIYSLESNCQPMKGILLWSRFQDLRQFRFVRNGRILTNRKYSGN